ncbi:MAG: anthranilate synthase component I [Candidatus Rokubacteria bacterium GWC2_70_24]|nr:MAG: anthranilate synthase component I [Candidatus Rokubacteria bacterium GWA2_70_23]OGK87177.1 MAG: anthranilate synthase component I [Candidatus Rokubacteria bacterium GWC2_70_24]OGK92583.1 MAG: anthranilate synthase component I [Candidatus Rokubacteria bacterium GWF2_70_14]HAM57866.1 anthranilate synthase component I [Candidatus Rokubacteria bacterium]
MRSVAPGIPALSPSREGFRALAARGNMIPVYAELAADLDTPLSAFLRLRPGPYAFLLESVEGGEKWARYSFLGSDPLMVFTARGTRVTLRHADGRSEQLPTANPFEGLRGVLSRFTPVAVPGLPRFQGGAVGFFSYDMIRHVERLPRLAKDDLRLPDAVFMLTDSLLAFDNLRHRMLVIANAHVGKTDPASLDRAYDQAAVKIGMLLAKLGRPARPPAPLTFPDPAPLVALGEDGFTSTMDEASYMERVRRAKEYIASGDAYQIVVSRRLDTELKADPFTVYRALRSVNPSPYLFFLRLGRTSIVGSSPEVLVRLEDGRVEERPIAGTHPRGATDEEDARLAAEMTADPKERAEHVMLVDLGRNDVGRVSRVGSVEVTEFMVVERYSHVMHLVSHVRGQLAAGKDAFDVLAACFPAGTLTGAPKIRAMEIIEELEPTRRGPYGGAVGYISYSGNLDSCITIRTVVCCAGRASIQVGAGIVADSDPKTEWLETCSKSRGMILALRIAGREAAG